MSHLEAWQALFKQCAVTLDYNLDLSVVLALQQDPNYDLDLSLDFAAAKVLSWHLHAFRTCMDMLNQCCLHAVH